MESGDEILGISRDMFYTSVAVTLLVIAGIAGFIAILGFWIAIIELSRNNPDDGFALTLVWTGVISTVVMLAALAGTGFTFWRSFQRS